MVARHAGIQCHQVLVDTDVAARIEHTVGSVLQRKSHKPVKAKPGSAAALPVIWQQNPSLLFNGARAIHTTKTSGSIS